MPLSSVDVAAGIRHSSTVRLTRFHVAALTIMGAIFVVNLYLALDNGAIGPLFSAIAIVFSMTAVLLSARR